MNAYKATITSVGAALLLSASAQAASITFNQTISMPNDTTVTINLPQFDNTTDMDPAGGLWNDTTGATLTSVTVTVKAIIADANVQMDNDAAVSQNGTARVQNLVNSYSGPSTLNGSFGQTIEAADMQLNESQVFNLGATSGDTVGQFDVTAFSDYASWSPGTLEAGDSGVVNSIAHSVYQGNGNLSFSINSTYTTSASFSGETGFFQGNTPSGSFFAEVTYEYAAVPEPSAYGLLIGLSALSWIVIRRRR